MELGHRLAQDLPLDETLREVAGALLVLVPANHASIRVFDEGRKELLCGARAGEGSGHRPMRFLRGEGIVGWVAEYGRTIRVGDAARDARFKAPEAQGFEFRSIVAVPIRLGAEVMGVLAGTCRAENAFEEEDERLAQLLADASAPVIQASRLRQLARFDSLTGAHKSATVLPRLTEDLAAAGPAPTSVVVFDLDRLRRVYEEHGHPVGDIVLRRFVERVRELLPPVVRLHRRGGGNFVLVCPGSDGAAATELAETVRRDLETRPVPIDNGRTIGQRVSAGVAAFDGSESPSRLLHRAEEALARAKAEGRNRTVVG